MVSVTGMSTHCPAFILSIFSTQSTVLSVYSLLNLYRKSAMTQGEIKIKKKLHPQQFKDSQHVLLSQVSSVSCTLRSHIPRMIFFPPSSLVSAPPPPSHPPPPTLICSLSCRKKKKQKKGGKSKKGKSPFKLYCFLSLAQLLLAAR